MSAAPRRLRAAPILSVLALLPLLAAAGPAPRHLALSKSAPAADAVVEAPDAIRLWFTQVPQEGATSVRLLDGAGEPVALGEPVADASDGRAFTAPVPGALAPGTYTVAWRTMAADGHVIRGDFAFTVRAAR